MTGGASDWGEVQARALLRSMFDAAVASAEPAAAVARHLPQPPRGRCVVVGAGKAAAAMAAGLDAAWPHVDLTGVVVTTYGSVRPAGRIAVIEAAHPVPDAASAVAARRMLDAVAGLTADDLVVALISGGGSSLLALPRDGMTLADKQAVTAELLTCGATIAEMNVVRKHLSAIKGGRLAAAAAPASLLTLLISDVPGDDPGAIASGPTVADHSTAADARAIVARYAIDLPPAARDALARHDEVPVVPTNGDVRIVASPAQALAAAAAVARAAGVTPIILGDAIEGEARELGIVLAGIARSIRARGHPAPMPAVLLSGGETTVSIGRGPAGRGGRNTELLLSLALALQGAAGTWALAGDTDGIDGTEDAAGAIVTPSTLQRARAARLDLRDMLARHDSYSAFAALGDLVRTGPTHTNVNDFRAVLVV